MRVFRHALVLLAVLGAITWRSSAITEEPDKITMRDASATKDRPRLEAFDMDEETQATVE